MCVIKTVSLRFFFFNDTATTEIYTLSLHDALPITQATRSQTSAQVGHPWSKRTGNPLVAPPCRYRNLTPPASRNRSVTDAGSGCPGSVASARDASEPSVMVSRDEGPDFR